MQMHACVCMRNKAGCPTCRVTSDQLPTRKRFLDSTRQGGPLQIFADAHHFQASCLLLTFASNDSHTGMSTVCAAQSLRPEGMELCIAGTSKRKLPGARCMSPVRNTLTLTLTGTGLEPGPWPEGEEGLAVSNSPSDP